ncbi:YicC/YloC family endoribonuclease [Rhodospirillaceae bacterium SYSU D60014]|uniref:YicC/YloC family endoribonuclease n=1 Tax=Virgifigura deserti TaxID=2268457 RepID=UPI0013C4F80F
MSVASMTGFARTEGSVGDLPGELRWAWEIRSVNGRSLDVRCRLPTGFDRFDSIVRAAVPDYCKRGNVSVTLTVTRAGTESQVRINRDLLDRLLALVQEVQERSVIELAPPRLDGLLAVKGVVESIEPEENEEARIARDKVVQAGLTEALDALRRMRAQEGDRLAALARGHLDQIETLRAAAAGAAATQPDSVKARLKMQVEALLEASPALQPERLAQEAALLATRADVREELDRLAAHVTAARDLLTAGGPIGRKFDFLCQEFNREANTLCSKSSDVALTRIGLDLKATIEQLREQVQNIE